VLRAAARGSWLGPIDPAPRVPFSIVQLITHLHHLPAARGAPFFLALGVVGVGVGVGVVVAVAVAAAAVAPGPCIIQNHFFRLATSSQQPAASSASRCARARARTSNPQPPCPSGRIPGAGGR
jgi:hypothetical protein